VTAIFAWPFIVLGLLMVAYAGRLLITGRNFSGFLGRGLTESDELRMKRAPAAFFRAVGTVAGLAGLLLIFFGVLFASVPNQPDRRLGALALAVLGFFMIAMVVSLVWLLLLAGRYRLFRWDKP
jgi:hypothetical protein